MRSTPKKDVACCYILLDAQICVKNLKKDDRVQKKRQYPHLKGPLVHERCLLALIGVHVLFFFACIRSLLDNA